MNRSRHITMYRLGLLAMLGLMVCAELGAGETPPATPSPSETLVLKSGDELIGTSVGFVEGSLRWKLPGGGVVSIPLENIERLEIAPSADGKSGGEGEEKKGSDAANADGKSEPEGVAESEEEEEEGADAKADAPEPVAEEPAIEEPVVETDKATEAKEDPNVETAAATEANAPPVLEEPLPITDAWYEAARSTYAFSKDQTGAWTKRFEFGGTWVEGNSNTTEAYVGGVFERQYEKVFHQLDWNGRHSTADHEVTQSRWQLNGTTDLSKNEESKWILFATHKHLFDQLADLNYRGTFASGIGYRFFNEGEKRLIARIGPGTTIEKYDPPEGTRLTYDAFAEIEAKWPVLDRTHLEYKSTFTPSMEDIAVFRVTSNYGLLVALDESESWAMKLGLRHDHNSDPNPDLKKNDFTTTFSVVYSRK